MKILKRISLGLGIASMLFFNACTDDPVDPNNNGGNNNAGSGSAKTCKITKAVGDDGSEETYTWDGDQLVKQVVVDSAGTSVRNFNYVAGKLTEIVEGDDTYKLTYTDDKVTQVDYSEGLTLMTVSKIDYNEMGSFNFIESYEIDAGKEVLTDRFTYTYKDSKLEKITILSDFDGNGALDENNDLLSSISVAASDDKKNPFYNLPNLWMDFADIMALVPNNPNALVIEIFGIPVPFSGTYEYNEHGYPTKANLFANGETVKMEMTYVCE